MARLAALILGVLLVLLESSFHVPYRLTSLAAIAFSTWIFLSPPLFMFSENLAVVPHPVGVIFRGEGDFISVVQSQQEIQHLGRICHCFNTTMTRATAILRVLTVEIGDTTSTVVTVTAPKIGGRPRPLPTQQVAAFQIVQDSFKNQPLLGSVSHTCLILDFKPFCTTSLPSYLPPTPPSKHPR